jgi:hypothetical protein
LRRCLPVGTDTIGESEWQETTTFVPNVTNTYHLTYFPVVLLHRVVTFGTIVIVFCHLLRYRGSTYKDFIPARGKANGTLSRFTNSTPLNLVIFYLFCVVHNIMY